uniref:Cation-transporting P-type ATPase N-terminal domain-containing protein n=2 Tax=Acrobeloides nanus TaxID=290746 RepID=A0A914EFV2_9BILA
MIPSKGNTYISANSFRYFTYRKILYFWHPEYCKFEPINSLDSELQLEYFHNRIKQQGFNDDEVEQLKSLYGRNLIEIKLKPIIVLVFKEILTPFYIFQVFSLIVWYSDDYEYYATVVVFMSLLSIFTDVYQIRKQETRLQSMVQKVELVKVLRNGKEEEVFSDNLVPGDIILIPPHGCVLQCDAVLMNGTVIVNEAMLTGESVPVMKVGLPDLEEERQKLFSNNEHSKHLLFCGTQVLQTRFYRGKSVQAVVVRTAFATQKGQLVRSIMYPKPVDFRFTKDLLKFIGVLAGIATIGLGYSIAIMIIRGSDQMRLRAKQIFCISPSTINTCGGINTVCFDKTGTLTEDGLDFNCLLPVSPDVMAKNQAYFKEETEEFKSRFL